MILYYGNTPGFENEILALTLSFTAVFINWMRRFSWERTILLVGLAIAAMWTAWVAAFYFVPLGIVALLRGKRQHRIAMIAIGVVTILATLLIPVLYEVLHPGALHDLQNVFFYRASNQRSEQGSETFTLLEFMRGTTEHMLMFMSFGVVILGAIGLIWLIRKETGLQRNIILALLMTPILYLFAFRNAFFFHDYYKIHLMPAFTLAAGYLIFHGWRLQRVGFGRYVRPLIVSIVLVSCVVAVGWTFLLYQSGNDPFVMAVIADLPEYTEIDDHIISNVGRPYPAVEYHAFRNIGWGNTPEVVAEWAREEARDTYYMLCLTPETVASYAGALSDLPYEMIGDSCRLIYLKPFTEQAN
jgi:hypothetical protein